MSEYEKQAIAFCQKTNTEISIKFLKHDKYFYKDTEKRDIYEVVIKRGNRQYRFKFGNSIKNSGKYLIYTRDGVLKIYDKKEAEKLKKIYEYTLLTRGDENKDFKKPTEYRILACLQKYDVGSFDDFCNEFGYNESYKLSEYNEVKKIYEAVVKEYNMVLSLYNDEELEELREIQ